MTVFGEELAVEIERRHDPDSGRADPEVVIRVGREFATG
jgi:hypothetical protein